MIGTAGNELSLLRIARWMLAWLLPGFDELLLGYRDGFATLDPAYADLLVPGAAEVRRRWSSRPENDCDRPVGDVPLSHTEGRWSIT